MKTLLLTLSLIIISPTLFGQNITIGEDGIVRCKDVAIGTTEVIFGETYEVVDRALLEQRRDEGADLTKSCVSNVTSMSNLFYDTSFNQPIGNWDVSSVTSMTGMFSLSNFNQPINNWDVSSVKRMNKMFYNNDFFNQPIGNWDVSSVTDMSETFKVATSFNESINSWNVSSVTDMSGMFDSAINFNQPIGNWNVSSVTDMSGMFDSATNFNQPIGNWNVSSVTDMSGMFRLAINFNQNLNGWDVSSVTDMSLMFYKSQTFDSPIGSWDVGNVTDLNSMFRANNKFNQEIGQWDVSSVNNMRAMFDGSSFNQPIGNWDVSNVSDMRVMFGNATNFNQSLKEWCVVNIVTEPQNFSINSPLTEENKPVWGTCPGTPEPITQLTPSNSSTDIDIRTPFTWEIDSSSTHYQLQVFEGQSITLTDTLVDTTSFILPFSLKPNTTHYWKVRGINNDRGLTGEWSDIWSFTTELTIYIDDNGIVRCTDVPVGTKEIIDAIPYIVVDDSSIRGRHPDFEINQVYWHAYCVSNVTDMRNLFTKQISINQNPPIENWDVSSVTLMDSLLMLKHEFNRDLNKWDVSNVKSMSHMFYQNKNFNGKIDKWDVSNVTDMSYMFERTSFNQPIGGWDVSNVTNMEAMFFLSDFNQDISNWDVSNVTDMSSIFRETPFNRDISSWDVSNVTDMYGMFWGVWGQTSFNQPIGNWDVSNVTNMEAMFLLSDFNQDISNWDVSNVTDMSHMFIATPFNQPIGNWDVSNVTDMYGMFENTPFNQDIGNWDVSSVINMDNMFQLSDSFKGNISSWCVINITQEPQGFSDIPKENQPKWGTCPGIPTKPLLLYPSDGQSETSRVIKFDWSSDSLTTKNHLQISNNSNEILNDTLVTVNNFINIIPLRANTQYYWKVRSINFKDSLNNEPKTSDWSQIFSFTTGGFTIYPPDSIYLKSPLNDEKGITTNPTLKWMNDTQSDSFHVEVSTDNFETLIHKESIVDTSLTLSGLEYNTSYFWKVRGRNTSGVGDWSEVWSFTTVDVPLVSPSLSTPFNEQVNVGTLTEFTWNEVESSVSYHLQVSTDEVFSATVFDSSKIGSSSFTLTEPLSENTTYFWRMKSISDNELRNSQWSDTLTFTTGVRTSIEDELIPQEYTLYQNYPNPFNPSTQIQYALPEATQVTLEVFNSVGQKVMELVNGQKSAGYHTATFDASGLSSGVYLYKLTTPSFSQTNKMLLIK